MSKKTYTEVVEEINAAVWLIDQRLVALEKKVDAIKFGTITATQHEMYAESLKAMSLATEALTTRLR